MKQEFPIAKGKNLTTIEWFNLMSCDLTLEYDCKKISIHEYTARKLELLNRARQMEKEQMIDFGKKCQMVHDVEYGDGGVTFLFTPEQLFKKTYKK